METLGGGEVAGDAIDIVWREAQQPGQQRDDGGGIFELLRDYIDTEAGAVDRDWLVVAVNDPAAPRRHWYQLDAIALTEQFILFVLRHRQIAEPRDQCRANQPLRAADQQHSPRESQRLVRPGILFAALAEDAHRRPQRQRSMRETIIAAIGKARIPKAIAGRMRTKATGAPLKPAIAQSAQRSTVISKAAMPHSIQ